MNNLLTNKNGAVVKKRISELISLSGELKILVGFFYFSGIKALYEALVANPTGIEELYESESAKTYSGSNGSLAAFQSE